MKRLLLIFTVSILFASFSYAQKRNDLTGPRAKNYKPWKDNSKKSDILLTAKPERLTGPQAKNKKPWDKSQKLEEYTAVTSSGRYRLKGPKAKNWKPWQSDQSGRKVDTKTASDEPKQKKDNGSK